MFGPRVHQKRLLEVDPLRRDAAPWRTPQCRLLVNMNILHSDPGCSHTTWNRDWQHSTLTGSRAKVSRNSGNSFQPTIWNAGYLFLSKLISSVLFDSIRPNGSLVPQSVSRLATSLSWRTEQQILARFPSNPSSMRCCFHSESSIIYICCQGPCRTLVRQYDPSMLIAKWIAD